MSFIDFRCAPVLKKSFCLFLCSRWLAGKCCFKYYKKPGYCLQLGQGRGRWNGISRSKKKKKRKPTADVWSKVELDRENVYQMYENSFLDALHSWQIHTLDKYFHGPVFPLTKHQKLCLFLFSPERFHCSNPSLARTVNNDFASHPPPVFHLNHSPGTVVIVVEEFVRVCRTGTRWLCGLL